MIPENLTIRIADGGHDASMVRVSIDPEKEWKVLEFNIEIFA